jgi:Ran GTPase-activating protein (RanGAP) involved in mRNA processing and transport
VKLEERKMSVERSDSSNALVTLIPLGSHREVVDTTRAAEFVEHWNSLLSGDKDVAVKRLQLSNKSYTVEASDVIAQFLGSTNLSQLMDVNLSDIIASLPEEDGLYVLQRLSDALASQSYPKRLVLSDNALGCKGIEACTSLLQKSSLKELELCNNGLSEESMHRLANLLRNSNSSSIQVIKIANNMSGRGGCEAMAAILRESISNLKEFMFSGTRADSKGSAIVAQAIYDIQPTPSLHTLHLADNFFSGEGAKLLSKSLVTCQSLQSLNLRDCCLSDEDDIPALVQSLIQSNCPLQFLDLSGNELTFSPALKKLISAKTSTLTALRLEENELQSKGIKALVKVLLSGGSKLKELLLGHNQCSTKGAEALLEASSALPLEILGLDGNSIPPTLLQQLRETYGPVLQEIHDNNSEDEDETEEEEEEDQEASETEEFGKEEETQIDELAKELSEIGINL